MRVRFIAFAAALYLAVVPNANAQSNDEVAIGPVEYTQDVNGVPVTISATSFVKLVTTDSKLSLHVRVLGDLIDLQKKIGAIVDTFNLPSNNCGSYSPNNPVVSIPRKELKPTADGAVFSIGGSVTMWQCVQNPVPNSKLDWEIRNVGFGIKTKVPVVRTWPGNPIKTILVTQPFDADLPVYLVKNNEHAVGVQFSKPDIELKGNLAFITKGVLKIAGININDKAYDALQKAIDPQKLSLAIPEEVMKYNPIIESARLFDSGGHLTAEISMSALVPADTINALIKELMAKKA
ncbi:hypothetical protein [Hyphomicrobium sp.]|uniref:hypothetical protein n=1 Tax=Hyphomicrobium sp. TaxID=82 RepID=UPI001DBBC98C|nr:hypothetical protein [Hyphomicrobium sp.]MBY0561974.1 hypothetical protein [Hyphomicrobium sp.]